MTGRGPAAVPTDGAHVAVAQSSFLGDVILTTPLLHGLRAVLQPRRLTMIVRPEAAPLVAHHPCVDAVVIDDKRGSERGPAGVVRMARRLAGEGVDVAVAPHRSLRTAIVLALAGIRRRTGFADSPGATLYHERVFRDRSRHAVERTLALLQPFGAAPDDHCRPPDLAAGVAAEAAAQRLLAERGLDDGRALYGVCPGSIWPTKRWTVEGYAGLVRALRAGRHATALLLGGGADADLARAIERQAGGGVVNLVGALELGTFVALAARLRVVIANDSAPMHVAVACGTPVVAIFCATTPAQGYGPYRARAEVVEADLECRPCSRHGTRRCPRATEDCMRLIRVERVLEAVHRLASPASGVVRSTPSFGDARPGLDRTVAH